MTPTGYSPARPATAGWYWVKAESEPKDVARKIIEDNGALYILIDGAAWPLSLGAFDNHEFCPIPTPSELQAAREAMEAAEQVSIDCKEWLLPVAENRRPIRLLRRIEEALKLLAAALGREGK